MINGLPLFHVAGSLLLGLGPLARGGCVILPTVNAYRNPQVIRNYWRLIEELKITVCGGIPTTLATLLDVPVDGRDLSSLKFCLTGGAYMPAAISRLWKEKLSVDVRQLYGMTETAGLIAASHHSSVHDPCSVGEVIGGAEVEVRSLLGTDGVGLSVPLGKAGMLVTRGPHVFSGYLPTAATASPFTGDGWLMTGDIGFMRADGRITVTGRAKDLIIRSGHNIDPAIIEEAAGRFPGVGISAAVGMPDDYAGEVPVIYVTMAEGCLMSSEALLAQLATHIAEPPAKPRHAFILDQMPTTAVGKIDKMALRRDATLRAVQAVLDGMATLRAETTDVGVREGEGGRLSVEVRTTHAHSEFAAIRDALGPRLSRYSFSHTVVALDPTEAQPPDAGLGRPC